MEHKLGGEEFCAPTSFRERGIRIPNEINSNLKNGYLMPELSMVRDDANSMVGGGGCILRRVLTGDDSRFVNLWLCLRNWE